MLYRGRLFGQSDLQPSVPRPSSPGRWVRVSSSWSFSIVAPSFQAVDLIKILGIGGVAIGFAFQNILQNFLAGLLLLWTEPFRVGDQIRF